VKTDARGFPREASALVPIMRSTEVIKPAASRPGLSGRLVGIEEALLERERQGGAKLDPSYSDGGRRMAREFSVVVERDSEGYFVASVPAIPGCHTQARSLDELMFRVREAIALNLEVEDDEIEDLEFIGVQRVTVDA